MKCEAVDENGTCQEDAVVTVEVITKFIALHNEYCDDHGKTIAMAASASGYDVIVEPVGR